MKVKVKPTPDGFTLECPKCHRLHEFTRLDFDYWILDGEEDDKFQVDERNVLFPEFVCRNYNCSFMNKLTLLGLPHE